MVVYYASNVSPSSRKCGQICAQTRLIFKRNSCPLRIKNVTNLPQLQTNWSSNKSNFGRNRCPFCTKSTKNLPPKLQTNSSKFHPKSLSRKTLTKFKDEFVTKWGQVSPTNGQNWRESNFETSSEVTGFKLLYSQQNLPVW